MQLDSLEQKAALLESGLESALAELDAAQAVFDESQQRIDALRLQLQNSRSESAICDRQAAEIRDTIARLEYEARESILKKERLSSESAQLKDSVAAADANLADVKARLDAAQDAEAELSESVSAKSSEADSFRSEVEELRANFGKMQAEAAAKEAELNYLNDAQDAAAAFSAFSRMAARSFTRPAPFCPRKTKISLKNFYPNIKILKPSPSKWANTTPLRVC